VIFFKCYRELKFVDFFPATTVVLTFARGQHGRWPNFFANYTTTANCVIKSHSSKPNDYRKLKLSGCE